MSRRAQHQATVSLFPFLAVLLCAMGALIVLLVVTTRMIRSEAIKKRDAEVATRVEIPAPVVDLGFSETFVVPTPTPPPDAPLIAPKPVYLVRDVPALPPDLTAELKATRTELARLRSTQQNAEKEATELLERLLAFNRQAQEQQQAAAQAEQLAADTAAGNLKLAAETDTQRRAREALAAELEETQREVAARVARRPADGAVQIVPYDGRNGTTRRPILVECRSDRFVFQPEGVEIREEHLLGFTQQVNPLRSGVEALGHYWAHKDGALAEHERPYVLLIVRPDGIAAFYAARKLLKDYEQPFGYELIPDDQPLAFGDADPNASKLCQTTIDRLMGAQRAVAGSPGDASPFKKITVEERTIPPNAPGPLSLEANTDPKTKGYRFVRTPRGMELVRDGLPEMPADEQPSASPPPKLPRPTATAENLQRPRTPNVGPPTQLDVPRDLPAVNEPPRLPLANIDAVPLPSARDEIPYLRVPGEETAAQSQGSTGSPTHGSSQSRAGQGLENGDAGNLADDLSLPDWSDDSPSSAAGERSPYRAPPSTKIALGRVIPIVVTADEIRVANEPAIPVAAGDSSQELLSRTLRAIRGHANEWGPAPTDFYWKPRIKFVICPGGNVSAARLQPYFEQRKLISETVYRLDDPNAAAAGDVWIDPAGRG